MSLTITALVIGGNSELLDETLFGLSSQSRKPDHILVGCTNAEEQELARKHQLPFIEINNSFPRNLLSLAEAVETPDWFWILFSDSCPDPLALESMTLTAETSPSASMVAPKLVEWDFPEKFVSFGKTITQLGESFELVDTEIDQGQHDLLRDVLASDFAGALVEQQTLRTLRDQSPPIAARSTVFGISQWLSGSRVLVEPKARVRIDSKHGFSGESHVFGAHFAKRFADYHLSLITLPRMLGFLYWLFLPAIAVGRSLWTVGSRQVRYFVPELLAGFASFLSVSLHLRASLSIRQTGKLRAISQLRADRAQTRDRRRRRFTELPPAEYRPSLLSGPWAWLLPVLVLLNFRLFPADEAVVAGNMVPLSANWFELIASGWRTVNGFPVDSVVFPLALISAISFWAPSAAVAWFIFIAPALAFAGVWLALARLTEKRLLVTVLSLGYAASPLYALQLQEPDISSTISYVLMGWLLHGLIMIIQSTVSSRAWRWTAWSAFLLALLSASVPYLLPVFLLITALLAIANLRRLGFLVFVPVLSLILLLPQLASWVLEPLAIFAPMGVVTSYSNDWQLDPLLIISLSVVFVLGVVAFLFNPNARSLMLISASAASVFAFAAIEHIQFEAEPGFISASSANGVPILQLGLIAILLIASTVNQKSIQAFSAVVVLLFAGFGAYSQLTMTQSFAWGEYRQVPAIVEVESQRFELNTLMISESAEEVWLRPGNGENLGESSMLAKLYAAEKESSERVAVLSASLIASNSEGIQSLMDELDIAFVQLQGENPQVASQLSRLPELTFAGQTQEGTLWRADDTELNNKRLQVSLSQFIPWAALLITILIALPTPASIRGRARIRSIR